MTDGGPQRRAEQIGGFAMLKSRVLASAALVGVLIAAGFTAGPALADDPPPLVWTPVSSTTVDDVTVTWETASSTTSPFDHSVMLDPMPVYRPNITNNSLETKYFGFGTDFVTQGVMGHLWMAAAWGAFDEVMVDSGILSNFYVGLAPGASMETGVTSGGAGAWYDGVPSWSGHTITIFELSEEPVDGADPFATPVASISTPGRFVAGDLSEGDVDNLSAVLGQRATVFSGVPGPPELFAGLTSTVEASGLTPGDTLELWIARDLNYALFQILGGGLPVGAIKVGEDTVAPDGTLSAPISIPLDLGWDVGETQVNYQLVAGVRAERYWPAGSYDDFTIKEAPNPASGEPEDGEATVTLDWVTPSSGITSVAVTYPDPETAGTTTAIVSPTGPLPDGFTLASVPPVYLHLETTGTFSEPATVCITYDPLAVTGPQPRLYHYDLTLNQWFDITIPSDPPTVCGLTNSFSPFAVGQIKFDFRGFFAPVSMAEENIAKPGQAIPVKFSLNGDQGMDVVTDARFVPEGTSTTFVGDPVEATTAGGSGLSYSASSDQYTYVWKTSKSLSKKTGRFELTLSDGTLHSFDVTFKK
jgi:hypothetical protein